MEGNIYINGLIGSMPMEVGVELIDVIQQVKKQAGATSFKVHINSEGGVVDTGFDIYNYLRSLQVPIETIGSGLVASIATVIFMAGDKRTLKENTKFMIHLPMGGVDGTADEIEQYAKVVRESETKLLKFYSSATNLSNDALFPLLRNETWLNQEQSETLGFVTQTYEPVLAKAYFNLNTDKKMTNLTNEDKSWIEQKFDAILNKFSAKKVQNIVLQDASGVELEFPEVAEGEEPAIDSAVLVAGEPANGEYIMPDGSTYVCADGLLKEIKPMEEEVEDVEAMRSELETLRKEKSELATALAESTSNVEAIKTEVLNLKKSITSKATIDAKSDGKKDEKSDEVSPAQKALSNLKSKRK